MFDGWEGVESTRKLIAEPDREVWAAHALVRYKCGGTAGLEQFSKFICFQPGYVEEDDDDDSGQEPTPWNASFVSQEIPEIYIPSGDSVPAGAKVGRNDPCPCGSLKEAGLRKGGFVKR